MDSDYDDFDLKTHQNPFRSPAPALYVNVKAANKK